MSLPTIKNATFTIKVAEFTKPLKIRPMIVAEHKSIQQAIDIGSDSDVAITIAEIVKSCTNGEVSATSVPQYIMDYVFLQIYIASVEGVVNSKYTCRNKLKDENGNLKIDEETGDHIICDGSINVKIPLSNAVIQYPVDYNTNKKVAITDKVSLYLKGLNLQQNIDVTENQAAGIDIINKIFDLSSLEFSEEEKVASDANKAAIEVLEQELVLLKKQTRDYFLYSSVDYIEDENGISKPEVDFTFEEFIKWIESCPAQPMTKIDAFFSDTPKIGMDIKVTCPECANSEDIKLKGLNDFFS